MNISNSSIAYIKHRDTHAFSDLVYNYLEGDSFFERFVQFPKIQLQQVAAAMMQRKSMPVDRVVLHQVLSKQYAGVHVVDKVAVNINALLDENTFTVCTAHQCNLLGGPLYFIYKIIHAAKLADTLNLEYEANHFVPIYYMGSEDNDIEELNHFFFRQKKMLWETNQVGAVGRMTTEGLDTIFAELFEYFNLNDEEHAFLKTCILELFNGENTIARATQLFVNQMLGRFGVLAIDADDALLKSAAKDIFLNDLLEHAAYKHNALQQGQLEKRFKSQAFARQINLFYLKGSIRSRIEKASDGLWSVVGTDITFNEQALRNEVEQHPERFSPNVILRGVYQERILPNVVFIGGGSEVAYWMQLKAIFNHFDTFYPMLVLRQSIQLFSPKASRLQERLGLDEAACFLPVADLLNLKVKQDRSEALDIQLEQDRLRQVLADLQVKATAIDATLEKSGAAALTKINHQVVVLQKKMLKAVKRQFADYESQLKQLKGELYPLGTMQERKDNFIAYYLDHGAAFFDLIYQATTPLGDQFALVHLQSK